MNRTPAVSNLVSLSGSISSVTVPVSVPVMIGAWKRVSTLIAKMSETELVPSVVVNLTRKVPKSRIDGVPEKVLVALSKFNQSGSGESSS